MNVLITGGGGQLASALVATRPSDGHLNVLSLAELDITDPNAVHTVVCDLKPDVVMNCAAYTAVDNAESDSEAALAVNHDGAKNLAEAASKVGARMVYPSTDFVFDGSQSQPWKPMDKKNPLSVYGSTKSAGEDIVLDTLNEQALVVRTAWVYEVGGKNFVYTMLRLMQERDSIQVVADQIGTPTWARSLAAAIWCMLENRLHGIHHWTDLGQTSWYEFAVTIASVAKELGILQRTPLVEPIPTTDFPTPAQRPLYSVLDKCETWDALRETTCMPPKLWNENLRQMMGELKNV